eukprot:1069430-Prymnesium_polylepis.1
MCDKAPCSSHIKLRWEHFAGGASLASSISHNWSLLSCDALCAALAHWTRFSEHAEHAERAVVIQQRSTTEISRRCGSAFEFMPSGAQLLVAFVQLVQPSRIAVPIWPAVQRSNKPAVFVLAAAPLRAVAPLASGRAAAHTGITTAAASLAATSHAGIAVTAVAAVTASVGRRRRQRRSVGSPR